MTRLATLPPATTTPATPAEGTAAPPLQYTSRAPAPSRGEHFKDEFIRIAGAPIAISYALAFAGVPYPAAMATMYALGAPLSLALAPFAALYAAGAALRP